MYKKITQVLTTLFFLYLWNLIIPNSVFAQVCAPPNGCFVTSSCESLGRLPEFGDCFQIDEICCSEIVGAPASPTPAIGCQVLIIGTCGVSRPVSCQAPGSLRCCVTSQECLDIGGTPLIPTPRPSPAGPCAANPPNSCRVVNTCADVGLFPAPGTCLQIDELCCGPNPPAVTPLIVPTKLCQFAGADGSPEKQKCLDCVGDVATGGKMWTALGCIPTDPTGFVKTFLRIAISVGGGIAFLMIVYGGFLCMTSAGNPEKAQNCREIITSAIAGLLLIIFSAIILRIIGVDILGGLPGFGGP